MKHGRAALALFALNPAATLQPPPLFGLGAGGFGCCLSSVKGAEYMSLFLHLERTAGAKS